MEKQLTWAEIDLSAYAHNIRELRRVTQPKARLMAVVKANGYGHGAVEVARTALQNGAEYLGVARIHEAVELRQAGLEAPILIFGYSSPDSAPTLIDNDLIQTVYSPTTAEALSEQAAHQGKIIKIHIKVDSGMGRLGLLLDEPASGASHNTPAAGTVSQVEAISRLANLEVNGIFTHFATSDSADKSYATAQLERFMDFLNQLDSAGLRPPLNHAANSGAVIDLPDSHLDMVRPGIATYGLYPSEEVNQSNVKLKPVMTLKSRIIHLKKVPAGFHVSYGITYRTEKPTTIATVPIGYADGFNRLLSSRGHMLVHGKRVPIVGRVCMDLTMLDVGALKDVKIEDEVVVFGQQGDQALTADELASTLNTINYEIVTSITGRVPRVYK
ncbi:Alanine racemase (EC [Olavius sp. associated proteobacterium Delta 1]|nr:Alanine racemase (EC [Olavius sp. associated proteobacterium Delta 1]